ncbi:MAG: ribbon-helix-helix protein, CopG family [Candidatus Poseidoniales archaeon]|nr:MAG: ribbon-helix-helix protein, CopG family [Candidatus Poseidoniales archaeon]
MCLETSPMTAPTQLVSLRLSEDDIARLEQRVGLDGTRSRSDVIRLAIKSLLDDEPLKAGMGRVTIDLGQDVMPQIEAVHALTGMDAKMLTRQGLDLAIRDQLTVRSDIDALIDARAEKAQARQKFSSEDHQ